MEEKNQDIYLILILTVLILFTWYYITLPGSTLSPNKKHPKPSVKTALTSYLIYTIPMILAVYYLTLNEAKIKPLLTNMLK